MGDSVIVPSETAFAVADIRLSPATSTRFALELAESLSRKLVVKFSSSRVFEEALSCSRRLTKLSLSRRLETAVSSKLKITDSELIPPGNISPLDFATSVLDMKSSPSEETSSALNFPEELAESLSRKLVVKFSSSRVFEEALSCSRRLTKLSLSRRLETAVSSKLKITDSELIPPGNISPLDFATSVLDMKSSPSEETSSALNFPEELAESLSRRLVVKFIVSKATEEALILSKRRTKLSLSRRLETAVAFKFVIVASTLKVIPPLDFATKVLKSRSSPSEEMSGALNFPEDLAETLSRI